MSLPIIDSETEYDDDHIHTVLETEEEVQNGLMHRSRPSTERRSSFPQELVLPRQRPPILLLTVFDDGSETGELIRIRSPRFIIGRSAGHLRVGIDRQISSRHVKISHSPDRSGTGWVLSDLNSRHGTFIRIKKSAMTVQTDFFVGGCLYRFLPGNQQMTLNYNNITKRWTFFY